MPVDGLSHQNVRLYYKGIKDYTDDEKRGDLKAGQWTAPTQRLFACVRLFTAYPTLDRAWDDRAALDYDRELERAAPLRRLRPDYGSSPTVDAATAAAAFAVWGAARGTSSERQAEIVSGVLCADHLNAEALTAAVGMTYAVICALCAAPDTFDGSAFVREVAEVVARREAQSPPQPSRLANRLHDLALHLDETPLDLQDRCNGTGAAADEAFPFAVAMFARNPALVEATLLSAVNVGGATSAVGALTGALLGAFNGWHVFPAAWREGLEDVARLKAEATALLDALG